MDYRAADNDFLRRQYEIISSLEPEEIEERMAELWCQEPDYDKLDENIRDLVKHLREKEFRTFSSCQGGEGHDFDYPTIRMWSDKGKSAEDTRHRLASEIKNLGIKTFEILCHHIYGMWPADGVRGAPGEYVEIYFWAIHEIRKHLVVRMWSFEHWDNGKKYLHVQNWENFRTARESEYPHNWLHHRYFMCLHSPRKTLQEVPVVQSKKKGRVFFPTLEEDPYNIQCVEKDLSVIFVPFPAFVRTEQDPEGWADSWHLWVEDRHPKPTLGEPVILFGTGFALRDSAYCYALFQEKYWSITDFEDLGLGPNKPSDKEVAYFAIKQGKIKFRSIDEPWEAT